MRHPEKLTPTSAKLKQKVGNTKHANRAVKKQQKAIAELLESGVPVEKLLDVFSHSSKYGRDVAAFIRRREGRGEGAI